MGYLIDEVTFTKSGLDSNSLLGGMTPVVDAFAGTQKSVRTGENISIKRRARVYVKREHCLVVVHIMMATLIN